MPKCSHISAHRHDTRTVLATFLGAAAVCLGVAAKAQDSDTATYRVTFTGNWTLESTPDGVVGGAHFTTLIGAIHNSNVTFWRSGEMASSGIENMAELGITSTLRGEIEASEHTHAVIQRGVSGGGTGTATFNINVPDSHPLITLTSMIGPSPDWFVGITGLSLLDGQDEWRQQVNVDLYPYDAGTEDGDEFSLSNPETDPQGVITSIRNTGKFSDEPMARLSFVLDTTDQPPGRVAGARVTPGVGELAVSWNRVSDADGYKVQWRSGTESFGSARERIVTGGSTTSVTIPNLTPGTRYFVRVIATKSGVDDGDPSIEASGIVKASAPGQVTGVSVTAGIERLTVSWNAVPDATGYRVQWRPGGQAFDVSRQTVVGGGSNTRTTITGLSGGTLYSVRVLAMRTFADDGPPSNVATGTPSASNHPPEASQPIAMQFLDVGESVQLELSGHFQDPERRTLTFSAVSDNTDIATVRTQDTVLTVRGIAWGTAAVTVTARDDGDQAVRQRFDVMVGRAAFFETTSVSVPEGGWARLTVRLNPPRDAPTTLQYVFGIDDDPDTHDADWWDHGGGGGEVVIPANALEADFLVANHDDDDIEPAREVFTVTLSVPDEHASHLVLGPATATVIIDEGVCDRTAGVRDTLRGSAACSAVTTADLAGRQSLTLAGLDIDALRSLDFSGLDALHTLDISGNGLRTLPSGLFRELDSLVVLRLDRNALTELQAGAFGDLFALERLLLNGNRLAALPEGVFHRVPHLMELQLHDNPGAPFVFKMELVRRDAANTAPGPATVATNVVHGAPFAMRANISVTNGELSGDRLTVSPGATFSSSVTVARVGDGKARVSFEGAPAIPASLCGDDQHPCFRGMATAVGDSLALFTNALRATDSPPDPELLADGTATRIDLSSLFSGAEGDPLTYTAQSSDEELLTVSVDGNELVVVPNEDGLGGTATVTLTATDPDGTSATLSFVVAIDPFPRGFFRGWRKVLLPR